MVSELWQFGSGRTLFMDIFTYVATVNFDDPDTLRTLAEETASRLL